MRPRKLVSRLAILLPFSILIACGSVDDLRWAWTGKQTNVLDVIGALDAGADAGKDLDGADYLDPGSADMIATVDLGETDHDPGDLSMAEAETDACTPDCAGKKCGDDGCGGSCGDCNDDVDCTDDSCDKNMETCLFVPDDSACNDNDVCTGLETCDPSTGCQNGAPLDCDDGNPCTSLDCDKISGCQYTPEVGSCPSNYPPCQGTCVGTECVFGVEALNGEDDDCDGYLDEDFDLDHDGVCDSLDCPVLAIDSCPTVWNPDGAPGICPPVVPGVWKSRPIALAQPDTPDGTSTWRRTNEPVEVPLWNGILDDSLIGYWKLDGNALDSIGQLHGIEHDLVPSIGAFGDDEGAFSFNGQSSRIVVLDTDLLDVGENDFSISVWLRPLGFDTYTYPVSKYKRGDFGAGWNITVSTDGAILFVVRDGGESAYNAKSESKLTASNWYHIVGVKVGESIQLWINGNLEKATSVGSGSLNCPDHFMMGKHTKNPEYYYGEMDEVVFMRRALRPNEIASYYHSHRPYGTNLIPGSQPDLDDVRIVETSPHHVKQIIPSEVAGVRTHSDTPCPMANDDGTWADRDDLCGVVGYWKLDGNGDDSSGTNNHMNAISETIEYTSGRFADAEGAVHLPVWGDAFQAPDQDSLDLVEFTIEAWVQLDGDLSQSIVNKGYYGSSSVNYHLAINGDHNPLCGFNSGTQQSVCTADTVVPEGHWTHLACTFDQSFLRVFVSGVSVHTCEFSSAPVISDQPLNIGAPGSHPADRIDEVLVHAIAKSSDYIYRRANPGVPTVRFLAHTEPYENLEGTYNFLQYDLQWAEDGSKHVPPILTDFDQVTKCHGLLSPCLGYAGWWRFNEGGGNVVVDESTWKHKAGILGTPEWIPAPEGLSYQFDGQTDGIYFHGENKSPAFDLIVFTVESHFLSLVDSENSTVIIHKGLSGSNYLSNYWLFLDGAGLLHGAVEYDDDVDLSLKSTNPVPTDEWQHATYLHYESQYELHHQYSTPKTLSSEINPTTNDWPLYIGISKTGAGDGWQAFWKGAIDFVRLMSRALTPDEFLHIPLSGWSLESCNGDDSDCDGDPDKSDCAPLEPEVFNGTVETCNNIDDDCDGTIDGDGLCPTGQSCVVGTCLTDGFVTIPAGSFWMGSPQNATCPAGYPGLCEDEASSTYNDLEHLHYVELTHPFEMQAHEVTQSEFETMMGWNPSNKSACVNCPIETVSWYDSVAYANERSISTSPASTPCYVFADVECVDGTPHGGDYMACMNATQGGIASAVVTLNGTGTPYYCTGYRLPTESEWEYSIRAGSNTAFYPSVGNDGSMTDEECSDPNLSQIGWFCGNSDAKSHPVGLDDLNPLESNEWGLFDMSGNVYEWVWDGFESYPGGTQTTPDIDPVGTDETYRVLRGGGYSYNAYRCRSAHRNYLFPDYRSYHVGFRLCRSL